MQKIVLKHETIAALRTITPLEIVGGQDVPGGFEIEVDDETLERVLYWKGHEGESLDDTIMRLVEFATGLKARN